MEDSKHPINAKQQHSGGDHDEEEDSKIFPQKLMEILSDDSYAESICWLPHGKAFTVRNRDLFARDVMPKFFSRKAKYSSFTRKLNRWNFIRVASGPEMGSYHHEYFVRDKPQLAAQMFCKNARSKLAMACGEALPAHAASDSEIRVSPDSMPSIQSIHPSVLAALQKEGQEGYGYINISTAPILGVSNLQLLERQVQLMQEEYAQRLFLQQLAVKEQMENNMLQQQFLLRQQQQQERQQAQPDAQSILRMRQLMELRARQRKGLVPTNGRASAA